VNRSALVFLVCLVPALSFAEAPRTVERSRLRVGDVVSSASTEIADVDLGPAPPPGGSRIIARDEVQDKIRSAGYEVGKLSIPQATRIVSASRHITPSELNELCGSELIKVLPAGISLVKAKAAREIVVSPGATVRGAKIVRPPRQKGQFQTTATLEFQSDGEIVARAPIPVTLDVSELAAQADLPRGHRVTVYIDRKGIRVSTSGTVQTDANVGDVVQVQIATTGRVVKASVKSTDEAEVIETQ